MEAGELEYCLQTRYELSIEKTMQGLVIRNLHFGEIFCRKNAFSVGSLYLLGVL